MDFTLYKIKLLLLLYYRVGGSLPAVFAPARLACRTRDQREHRREYRGKSQDYHRSLKQLRVKSLVSSRVDNGR